MTEIEEGKVNIKIMLNNPISIPEHSKFLEGFRCSLWKDGCRSFRR